MSEDAARTFLMVSPLFPPCRLVGAKRALHLARHLPELGWDPAVFCLPEDHERDPALDSLVPDVVMNRNVRSGPIAWFEDLLRPGKSDAWSRPYASQHVQTDPAAPNPVKAFFLARWSEPNDRFHKYSGWAAMHAKRFCRQTGAKLVYANGGPFTALILAEKVARSTDLPLVLDLRDPWSIEPNYRKHWSPTATRIVESREQQCFERASAIVLNTEASRDAYREAYHGRIAPERFHAVRNAWDPSLLEPSNALPGEGPLRIVYYGHLRPTKNSVLFLHAFRELVRSRDLSPRDMEIVQAGDISAADAEAIEELGLREYVHGHPWLPFPRSRDLLGTAHVLLDLMGPEHHLQISGKLYDYLGAGRTILSVSPNPEVGRILAGAQAGVHVSCDVPAIVEALGDLLDSHREGSLGPLPPEGALPHSAQEQSKRLAAILDAVHEQGTS